MMTTSKNKILVLLMLLFVFFAAIFAVLLGIRLSQSDSTVGNPNAAISCSYCDKAYDKTACKLNCEAINTTNAGTVCPAGTSPISITRNDQTRFVGCKTNGADIGRGVSTGEACNSLLPTLAGYSKSYYGYCVYEPVTNCRWWNPAKGGVNNANAWEDCGCAAASDAAVQSRCNASNAGQMISFICPNCGQDAGAVCPGVFDPATARSFNGTIQCSDNGVLKPVSNVQVQVVNTTTGAVVDTKSTGTDGKFNLIAPNELTSNVKYTVKVTGTASAAPVLTSTLVTAVGFTGAVQSGCTPGASAEANSTTYCNTTCTAGAANSSYDSCTAGTGVSNGYNFTVGNCNTVAPSFVCYKCDQSTWSITSNTQATACDEVSNFKDQAVLTTSCVAPQVISCYSCSGGEIKDTTVTQTGTTVPVCPTGTTTTKPASCKVTCYQCQDQNGSSVNVSNVVNDVAVCPTGWFTTPQACKNTCYYCDKTTDPNSWKVGSKTNPNEVCDNSKGEYSNASQVVSCVSPKPDVTIEKKAAKYQLATGENAVFTITVKNISTVNAIAPINVVDTFDAGLEFVNYTSTDFTCGTVDTVNRRFECTSTANLNAGVSKTITVTYKVTQSSKDLNNLVFVSLPSAPNGTPCVNGTSSADGKNETNCANNNSTDKVIMATYVAPDVTIEKKAAKYQLATGENAVFTITAKNISTVDAVAPISVVDTYDAGLEFVSYTSADFTCGTVDTVNRKYECTSTANLTAGQSKTITVTYKVTQTAKDLNNFVFISLPSAPNGTPCVNGTTPATGKNEANCANNNSSDKVIMPAYIAPDVTIEKKAAKYELANGENAVFTIDVWNLSDTVAKAPIKVDDTFDSGLQFINATSSDFTCGAVDSVNRKLTCTSDKDLVKGEVRTITLTYKVLDTNKEYANNAFVSLPNSPNGTVCTNGNTSATGSNEANCANNNASDKVLMKPGVVVSKPILNATKTGSATCDTTNTYSTIKYSITLTNSGNVSGTMVLVTDTLDTKLASAEITNISDNGSRNGNKITWGSVTMPAGTIKVLTYSVKIKASDASSLVNSVDFDVKETGQKVSVKNTVKISCVTSLPKSSVDSNDKILIMALFATVILLIGVMGYKLNIATFAATYRGRKVGSRKFESDITEVKN